MTSPRDLSPAAVQLAALARGVREDDLLWPTPSSNYLVGDLLEHVDGLSRGLQAAARKESVPQDELRDGDRHQLRPGWGDRITEQLDHLVRAWAEPDAWEGETVEGGVPLPASMAGMFVLDELVVHGWELARATGQPFEASAEDVSALIAFLESLPPMEDSEGLFDPPVPIADSAPAQDRLIALTGRDPSWSDGSAPAR
ncbi:TIGR03086 family protein [Brachybacterium endophyticum]|uniref:TIGR03086 family protein n=1 Tax=Brachybacterium endophyticum TaxID=2182385 RepID=A0A2U2RHU3_9MICO|nr:TIGR03086 family metal-binding protein [Brachybacterium endophyticum]PWH05420.1 TIGR03086 family protein [Brachybacterium endophyticum]